MSITKIWTLNASVSEAYAYVSQEHKTVSTNPDDIMQLISKEASAINSSTSGNIGNALGYIGKDTKTKKQYLSGINCNASTASEEMQAVKRRYKKTHGAVGYHCVQSFNPGEIDPEMAHQIGLETAQELWGKYGYQVVIATHLDRNHLHNHFVINSVNALDGSKNPIRYHKQISKVSDSIVKSHGYSIIENPEKTIGRQHRLSKRQQEVKQLLDADMLESNNLVELSTMLSLQGYYLDYSANRTYWTIKHESWERPLRLIRLGTEYSNSGIIEKLENHTLISVPSEPLTPREEYLLINQYNRINTNWKNTPQYQYYISMYRLGIKLPYKKRPKINKNEVKKMQENIRKIEYLNHCSTSNVSFLDRKTIVENKILYLESQRKHHINKIRRYRRNDCSYIEEQKILDSINNELETYKKENKFINTIYTEAKISTNDIEILDREI